MTWAPSKAAIAGRMVYHTVEFWPEVGVYRDGVLDSSVTSGPFSWTVPDGCVSLVDILMLPGGAGGSGGAATSTNTSCGGGGGGTSCALTVPFFPVLPGETLTITCGARGTGGAAGTYGGHGGNSTLTRPSGASTYLSRLGLYVARDVLSPPAPGLGASGSAGAGSASAGGYGVAAGQSTVYQNASSFGGLLFAAGGYAGGAGNASGSVAGSNGTTPAFSPLNVLYGAPALAGTGNTTGTVSRGGGGQGAPSPLGPGGAGGNGGANGSAATWPGAGGGGGGGGDGAGGNGGVGYVKFGYWANN